MAIIPKTAFEDRITGAIHDPLGIVSGIFHNADGENEVCSAGFLVKITGNSDNEGYPGVKNEATYIMEAAAAADLVGTPIFACDTYNVNQLTDGVNVYKIGCKTLGLAVPAGEVADFCRIYFDGVHRYRFGVGNAKAALGENKFLTIADGQLVPAAAAPTANGTPYFEVVGSGNFTEGNRASFEFIDVVARTAVGSAAGSVNTGT